MQAGAEPRRLNSFGEHLACYRAAAGLTQEELAERAELSVRGLRYLERGLRRPYRDTVERLAQALDLPPAERGTFLAAARPRPAAAASSGGRAGSSDVPVPPGPLIGREQDVYAAVELMHRADVRVLTLTGTGGVGKTRLAIEVASHLHRAFNDGVAWVPLAALTDSRLVASAVAQALEVMESGGLAAQEMLKISLRGREIVLLLDNFEQVMPAAPLLSDLVAACPRLKLLITSRAALGLRSELEFPVSPLRPPAVAQDASVYALAANPAVALFLRRAQATTPDFGLTEANAAVVAEICRRLEGLPLALELAAARIRVLPPQAMLKRLAHRLSFLTGGPPDAPPRQRTMRETIAWSYDLLSPEERVLFRRLAVFAGGWDLPAVEAVCNAAGDLSIDVLDGVEALHRNSLIKLEETADLEPRFSTLEAIREYALERLAVSGEEDELRKRHAVHYVAIVQAGAEQFFSPLQGQWLDLLEREHDNLRAALRWCIARREAEMGLRLTAGVWPLWYVRGYSEGRTHLAALLALADSSTVTASRAGSLLGAGQLALWQGDYEAARTYLEESIRLYRTLGDDRGTADSLLSAGFVARVQEEYETARALLEEGLALSRAIGHGFITAASLHHLGIMAADSHADYAAARSLLEESLAVYRRLDLPRFIGLVLFSLGDVCRAEGDRGRARRLFREGLTTMIEVGERMAIPAALDSVAHLAVDEGRADRAVRLAGAAARLRGESGTHTWPAVQRSRERWLAAARETLGDDGFTAAWREGQTMASAQGIGRAVEDARLVLGGEAVQHTGGPQGDTAG